MAGAVIIGAGPGIGTSVARRFAAAGMPVGLISRTAATVDAARAAVAAAGRHGGRRGRRCRAGRPAHGRA